MSKPLVYTIDYDSIFRVPPNSTVLHAANETDLTEPDVFTGCKDPKYYYRFHRSDINNTTIEPKNFANLHHTAITEEEPPIKDVTGCPDQSGKPTITRSDSATSHELLNIKPDDLKEVPVTPVAKRSIKKFIKKIFGCA